MFLGLLWLILLMGKVVNKDEKFGKISAMEKKFLSLGDAEDYLFRWQTIE